MSPFSKLRVLVVGDLMLDHYICGSVNRVSPEAPVPVLEKASERFVPGGAANVALNVRGLGANVALAGVVGNDTSASILFDLLDNANIASQLVASDRARPTTCKTRVVAGNHQIVRIDTESKETYRSSAYLNSIMEYIPRCQAVIISDYCKGALSHELIRETIVACRAKRIPVLVDSKRCDYSPFVGATCITPNEAEFERAFANSGIELHVGCDAVFSDHPAGTTFREILGLESLLITQGERGMTLITEGQVKRMGALVAEVFDVSGAGDTVIATFTCALAAKMSFQDAFYLSNQAASIVVGKVGTAPISWKELSAIWLTSPKRPQVSTVE